MQGKVWSQSTSGGVAHVSTDFVCVALAVEILLLVIPHQCFSTCWVSPFLSTFGTCGPERRFVLDHRAVW